LRHDGKIWWKLISGQPVRLKPIRGKENLIEPLDVVQVLFLE
jgi:hypothetical protein